MDNIEILLQQGTRYEIGLHSTNNREFQAFTYLTADWGEETYPQDFCDAIGASYQEALQALDTKLGEMFEHYGLPPHWNWQDAPTPKTQETVPQNDWALLEATVIDAAQLRYSIELLAGKNHEDAMRRSFITALVQMTAYISREPTEAECKALFVKVRDFNRESNQISFDYSELQHLFPQI